MKRDGSGSNARRCGSGHGRTLALILSLAIASAAGAVAPAGAMPQGYAKVDAALLQVAESEAGSSLSIIVRERRPSSSVAEDLVEELGGRVTHELTIVGGFSADVPGSAVATLAGSDAVARVWGDARVSVDAVDMGKFDTWPPNTIWQKAIRLPQVPKAYTGAGVTVALLDTGVSRVPDLGNRVLARVDFTPEHDGYDSYGHGTHMAGIIAGDGTSSRGGWMGTAPGASIVSVKVAGADGSTDVSVVLAGLEWIVDHQAEYDIRVLNLSFGTDSTQPYEVDPLNYAVERVWFSGIMVVVSAGNRGPSDRTINKPGDDPFVVTVGAADLNDTTSANDDRIAEFSSRGPTPGGFGKPEISAPGVTIVSNRDVGSTVDLLHPLARVDDAYFKGTGTSQAAAVVSGVAARMFQANPKLTPDVAKSILYYTGMTSGALWTTPLVDAAGAVRAARAHTYDAWPANKGITPSTGLGSLEGSRGSFHVSADLNGDGVPELVQGEVDVLGQAWDGRSWSARSWSADSWTTNTWSAYVGESPGWEARSWSGRSWSGTSWDGRSWSTESCAAEDWTGRSWSGGLWG
jgi:serine protease AprX